MNSNIKEVAGWINEVRTVAMISDEVASTIDELKDGEIDKVVMLAYANFCNVEVDSVKLADAYEWLSPLFYSADYIQNALDYLNSWVE